YPGAKPMRNLTVADIHTYYVIAGNVPVLVHNVNIKDPACDVPRLRSRAEDVHSRLDPIAANGQDTVVMSTEDGPDVIAGGVRDIRPVQRDAMSPDDFEARMAGQHGEVTAVERATEAGLTPRALASFPLRICPMCQEYLEEEGFRISEDGMSAVMRDF